MFNLAHVLRKVGDYDGPSSTAKWRSAIALGKASTHAALGLTYHMRGLPGDLDRAILMYHGALGLVPEDTITFELLNKALKESGEGSSVRFADTGLGAAAGAGFMEL